MDQYEAKFAELSRYAPRLVKELMERARRFRDGLKPEIKSLLVSLNLKDYDELYERAQLIERDMTEWAVVSGSWYAPNRDDHRFGKKPMAGSNCFVPLVKKNIGKLSYNPGNMCQFYGRRYGNGPCLNRIGACFGCGQHGYQVRNGPNRPAGPQVQP